MLLWNSGWVSFPRRENGWRYQIKNIFNFRTPLWRHHSKNEVETTRKYRKGYINHLKWTLLLSHNSQNEVETTRKYQKSYINHHKWTLLLWNSGWVTFPGRENCWRYQIRKNNFTTPCDVTTPKMRSKQLENIEKGT